VATTTVLAADVLILTAACLPIDKPLAVQIKDWTKDLKKAIKDDKKELSNIQDLSMDITESVSSRELPTPLLMTKDASAKVARKSTTAVNKASQDLRRTPPRTQPGVAARTSGGEKTEETVTLRRKPGYDRETREALKKESARIVNYMDSDSSIASDAEKQGRKRPADGELLVHHSSYGCGS